MMKDIHDTPETHPGNAVGDGSRVEYYLTLHQRRTMDGYDFDFSTWSSVVDLFERKDGRWRVIKRTMIYEKDRMDPHKPGEVPASYFEAMDLTPYPRALRYHCWRNEKFSGSRSRLVMKNEKSADGRSPGVPDRGKLHHSR